MYGLFIPPKPSQNGDFPGPFCWATQTPPGCRHFTGLSASLTTLELHSPPVLPNTMCMATSVSLPSKPRPPSGPSPRPLVQEASWMPLLPLLTRPHLEPEQCHYSVTTWIPSSKSFGGSCYPKGPSQTLGDPPYHPQEQQGLLPSNPALSFRQPHSLKLAETHTCSHHRLMLFPSQKCHRLSPSFPGHSESTKKCILRVSRSSSAPFPQKGP